MTVLAGIATNEAAACVAALRAAGYGKAVAIGRVHDTGVAEPGVVAACMPELMRDTAQDTAKA